MAIGKYKDLLKIGSFQAFLWTQFLGAFNDNLYKMVVSLVAVNMATGSDGGSGYLSLVGIIFMLPFLLCSGYAGYIADVYSKRTILVITTVFEIVVMGLGFLATFSGRIEWLLGVLFLMALQSTFFSPAKYGILPEMLPDKDLSRANGLLEMSTFLAIILGTSVGGMLFTRWQGHLHLISLILLGIAIIGTLSSLGIVRVPPSGAQKGFRLNPWTEITRGILRLYRERTLWLTALGIAYFWFLGALLQMDLLLLGKEVLKINESWLGILLTALVFGIGMGSIVAGRLAGDKVELGLVPLGALGIGGFSLLFFFAVPVYSLVAIALGCLGFFGGVFIVPLNALLQQKSGREEKGQVIATTNVFTTIGILLASGVLWILHDLGQFSANQIILIAGVFTLGATIYVLWLLPDFLIRFILWILTHSLYRIRIIGQEHVPFRGPALLVCNHLSYVDGFLVGACVQRFIRFMVYERFYENKLCNWLFRLMKAIPVANHPRKAIITSIERAREELRQGHVVCIFAEGAISRTGNLLPFKRGCERIVEGLDVPVIPVHLDQVWGSIFSFKNGRFFWKWPERLPYPVTVSFGKPLPATAKAEEIRQAILELGYAAVAYRRTKQDMLHWRFLKMAKRHWFSFAIADSTGKELTYGQTLIGSLLLSQWIRKQYGTEQRIGILLPASVAGALANIAVLLAGKIPVNLNFTTGHEALAATLQQCTIRTILTSKLFLRKIKIEQEGMIFLEEVFTKISSFQKAWTALCAFLLPACLLQIFSIRGKRESHALSTVIFTSGSTGIPKGVMLSHHNILSNIEGLSQLFPLTSNDRLLGVLPFFHSFGFTATLWFPLLTGFGVIYHANPLDAKMVGELTYKYQASILIGTPTFYRLYLRQCSPEEFASLRYAIVGAEKLREAVAQAFKNKYGLDLLEGYGCTELGPVVSVNTPNVHQDDLCQIGHKPGTVGHPIPGVVVQVVDPETGIPLPYGREGLILVKSPSQMLGYWEKPEETKKVLRDEWYVTGDIGTLDEDGFLRITDRLARFSKIGGEMVPHLKIEEAMSQILGEQSCVVTGIPDAQKGERLVAFYTHPEITPTMLWDKLNQSDLPKLWIPKPEHLYYLETIPLLGTGKVDLRQVKILATTKTGAGLLDARGEKTHYSY